MEANDVFAGDLLGMVAEILVQMMHKRSKGMKLNGQDNELLRKIVQEQDNKKEMDKQKKHKKRTGRNGHVHGRRHVSRERNDESNKEASE